MNDLVSDYINLLGERITYKGDWSFIMHPDCWRILHNVTITFLSLTFGRWSFGITVLGLSWFDKSGSLLEFNWDKTLGIDFDILWINLIRGLLHKIKEIDYDEV